MPISNDLERSLSLYTKSLDAFTISFPRFFLVRKSGWTETDLASRRHLTGRVRFENPPRISSGFQSPDDDGGPPPRQPTNRIGKKKKEKDPKKREFMFTIRDRRECCCDGRGGRRPIEAGTLASLISSNAEQVASHLLPHGRL